jgi:hypothetical protein
MNKFVKDEFDRALICRIDGAMFGSDVYPVAQRQSRHIPVTGNPPERNPSARAKSNLARITYARKAGPDPLHQRIR